MRIEYILTEMAKRAAEFKIQKREEKQKMKDTARKIKESRGSDPPTPPSTSTSDWQSQMYCLPDNILSCDPNASGQISHHGLSSASSVCLNPVLYQFHSKFLLDLAFQTKFALHQYHAFFNMTSLYPLIIKILDLLRSLFCKILTNTANL